MVLHIIESFNSISLEIMKKDFIVENLFIKSNNMQMITLFKILNDMY